MLAFRFFFFCVPINRFKLAHQTVKLTKQNSFQLDGDSRQRMSVSRHGYLLQPGDLSILDSKRCWVCILHPVSASLEIRKVHIPPEQLSDAHPCPRYDGFESLGYVCYAGIHPLVHPLWHARRGIYRLLCKT